MSKLKHILSFFSLFCLIAFGCNEAEKNPTTLTLIKPEKLRMAIAESVKFPFNNNDTIFYNFLIPICGNTTEHELEKFYRPNFYQEPYCSILEQKYKGKIWFRNKDYDKYLESIKNDTIGYHDLLSTKSKRHIRLMLTGKIISSKEIYLYEHYDYYDKTYSITKNFQYKNDMWSFKITSRDTIIN